MQRGTECFLTCIVTAVICGGVMFWYCVILPDPVTQPETPTPKIQPWSIVRSHLGKQGDYSYNNYTVVEYSFVWPSGDIYDTKVFTHKQDAIDRMLSIKKTYDSLREEEKRKEQINWKVLDTPELVAPELVAPEPNYIHNGSFFIEDPNANNITVLDSDTAVPLWHITPNQGNTP